jgi:hypothetical protein
VTFTVAKRADGLWEAKADPCAFHLAELHTSTAGFSYASSDRQACIDGVLNMFAALMIAPLSFRQSHC